MGGVFLAGVRPESPSRSDTFLLLRGGREVRRGGRVGSYVVRWAWSHYDSRVFSDSSGGAALLNQDARARRQAPSRATLRRSLGLSGGNCAGRRLDSTTKEEGD